MPFGGMLSSMGPRNAARKRTADPASDRAEKSRLVRPDPRDEQELCLAVGEADAGKGVVMTMDDVENAVLTGRWPDSSE
jgi:hypothetical protein